MFAAKKIDKEISDFVNVADYKPTGKDLYFAERTLSYISEMEGESAKRIDSLRLRPDLKPIMVRPNGIKRVPGMLDCSRKRRNYRCSLCGLSSHTNRTCPQYMK